MGLYWGSRGHGGSWGIGNRDEAKAADDRKRRQCRDMLRNEETQKENHKAPMRGRRFNPWSCVDF